MDALAALRLYNTEKATLDVGADFALDGENAPARNVALKFRIPTVDEYDRLMSQCTITGNAWQNFVSMRGVFLPALLVGWKGIRLTDFVAEGDEGPLEYMPQWIEAVLTKFAGLRDRAFSELTDRYQAQKDGAAKEKKT